MSASSPCSDLYNASASASCLRATFWVRLWTITEVASTPTSAVSRRVSISSSRSSSITFLPRNRLAMPSPMLALVFDRPCLRRAKKPTLDSSLCADAVAEASMGAGDAGATGASCTGAGIAGGITGAGAGTTGAGTSRTGAGVAAAGAAYCGVGAGAGVAGAGAGAANCGVGAGVGVAGAGAAYCGVGAGAGVAGAGAGAAYCGVRTGAAAGP
ncbi:hypothetical protein D9M73_194430 [compost metagenome]